MSKEKTASVGERVKKIGDGKESIIVKLSLTEIEDERTRVCDLLGRRENLTAALKSIKGDYKAKLDLIDERINVARRAACEGKIELEVLTEEWLTGGNEVVTVREGTGDLLRRRTARPEEMQEAPPLPVRPAPRSRSGGDGFPTSEEAFGNGPS